MSRKSKIIILLIIIGIVASAIVNTLVVADNSHTIYIQSGKTVDLTTYEKGATIDNVYPNQVLNRNGNTYCIQNGVKYNGNISYMVYKYTAYDSVLAYILNVKDDYKRWYTSESDQYAEKSNYGQKNIVQNLIWKYISTSDAKNPLTDPSNAQYYDWSTWSSNYLTNDATKSAVDEKYKEAEAYAEKYANRSIEIDTVEINGTKIKVNVIGNYDKCSLSINGKVYSDDYVSGTEITINNPNDDGSITVDIAGYITKYSATYYYLKNSNNQNLMAIYPDSSEELIDTDKWGEQPEPEPEPDPDPEKPVVSLQKYISEVYDEGGKNHQDLVSQRRNKITGSIFRGYKEKISNSIQVSDNDFKKYDNTVTVKKNQVVVYTIEVYNNGNRAAKNVIVNDLYNRKDDTSAHITSQDLEGNVFMVWVNGNPYGINEVVDDFKLNNNNESIEFIISEIPAGSTATIDVYYKTNETNYVGTVSNIASLEDVGEDANYIVDNNEYRTNDADYIKFEESYDVSLQKYISEVDKYTYGYRVNTIYDDNAGVAAPAKNIGNSNLLIKKDSPVTITTGQEVTYTIRVYNNESNVAKGTIIQDTLLDYTGTYSITQIKIDETDITNSVSIEESEDGGFHFVYEIGDIPANESKTLTVKISFNDYQENIIKNKVEIISETSTQFRIVDYDYVKMRPFDVSLQKYITHVDDIPITSVNATNINRSGMRYNISDESNYAPSNSVSIVNKSKYSDSVKIRNYQTVTYTIIVYNNEGSLTAKDVTIKDTLYYSGDYSVTINNRAVNFENNTYTYEIGDIPANESKTLTVKITFNDYQENIITNKVEITSETSKQYRTVDYDYVKMEKDNVSLQKYITAVNGSALTTTQTSQTNREDYVVDSNSLIDPAKGINYIAVGKSHYPVVITQGQTVTYTIRVYNNDENYPAYNVVISDTLSGYSGTYSVSATEYAPIVIGAKSNAAVKKSGVTYSVTGGEYTISEIPAGNFVELRVTITFSTYQAGTIKNEVKITDTNTKYRKVDSDYVEMCGGTVDVSMQKYIVALDGSTSFSTNNNKLTSASERKNRLAVTTNSSLHINGINVIHNNNKYHIAGNYNGSYHPVGYRTAKISTKNEVFESAPVTWPTKTAYPVITTAGQEVTYTIRVYNNGSNTAYGIEITDQFRNASEGSISNKVNITGIKAAIVAATSEDSATLVELTNTGISYNYDTSKFYITKLSGNSVAVINITMQLKTDDFYQSSYGTASLIKNVAYISSTRQTNNSSYRNSDADYIMMKKADVSLQKYITSYTEDNGTSTNNINDTRSGYYAVNNNSNLFSTGTYNHVGKNVTSSITSKTTYKSSNPIKIKKNNSVTYKIVVYNNGSLGTGNITVTDDWLSGQITNIYISSISSSTDIYNNNSTSNLQSHNVKSLTLGSSSMKLVIDKLTSGQSINIYVTIKYTEPSTLARNRARVDTVGLNGTNYRTIDADYIKVGEYKVSLEKYVSAVNGTSVSGREGFAEHKYDNNTSTSDTTKYNDVVTVKKGDTVTYTIKVTNNGDYDVYVTEITDYLPDGISYDGTDYTGGQYNTTTDNAVKFTNLADKILKANGASAIFRVEVTVIENNMSLNILKNTAEITQIKDAEDNKIVTDTTLNDNRDSDYIQLNPGGDTGNEAIIAGIVWNDKALNKTHDNYNGLYDSEESALSGIKVYLYREGVYSAIAIDTTDSNGYYSFADNDIGTVRDANGRVTSNTRSSYNSKELYIKGPRVSANDNKWARRYYSYYVVFEYDGITYTSTTLTDSSNCLGVYNTNYNDSNAKEDNTNGKSGLTTRTDFNNKFSTINNTSGISYKTNNEDGYIPQSLHEYNSNMAMQSSTNKITLSNSADLETQLEHVNLGLRGRDIFDLELTSDVAKVDVTVNGQTGTYNYSNKVTVRRSDLSSNYTVAEDMANPYAEGSTYVGGEQEQVIRKTDLENGAYAQQQLLSKIQVTYKITVQNASRTDGTATKITNYYDDAYTFVKAYSGSMEMTIANDKAKEKTGGRGYKAVEITTPGTNLSQSGKMEIYVVYTLNNPRSLLSGLLNNERFATYNMAEITEYTTKCASGQTEYTRGLIDKDSAPGSANTETVRLSSGSSNLTTVGYYFGGYDLSVLKYEDDTYATPTLYFVTPDGDDYSRRITGTVFEDLTEINSDFVKSGNGIKDGDDPTIKGITVELVENGSTVRMRTETDENGNYTFRDFLPGNYIIKYYYGDTAETFLKNYNNNGNEESYNGEDFQATNNRYTVDGIDVKKLSTRTDYWYLDNEDDKISTAKDDSGRRETVTTNVIGFTNEQMQKLNSIRDGEQRTDIGSKDDNTSLIGQTHMYATTANMLFGLEKASVVDENTVNQSNTFREYQINNMNFGIAEVPVTTIDLQKHVSELVITDAAGTNTIASATANEKDDGTIEWTNIQGNVIPAGDNIDISIEDEKLQGARLQVKYKVTSNMTIQKNFDNSAVTVPTITKMVDFIPNNLNYNANLGENSGYWQVIKTTEVTKSSLGEEATKYNTIIQARADNPLLLNTAGTGTATITLERVLSSIDSTIEDIVTSTTDSYTYENTIEIIDIDYKNVTPDDPDGSETGRTPQKDRVRTPDRYIIIPGEQHDTASSEIIAIHEPTGFLGIDTIYYVIAVICLGVLAVGIFGIKKFVIKK